MRNGSAKAVALGGVMAALALVFMCLGGLIPVATFVCPMICMLMLQLVYRLCGRRTGWAWYGAVAILSALLGPDKEAAAVFLFLGYYPLLKPWLDRQRLGWLLKLLLFNGAILAMYGILINLFGMAELAREYAELGRIMTAVMLALGNVCFFLLDFCLRRFAVRK